MNKLYETIKMNIIENLWDDDPLDIDNLIIAVFDYVTYFEGIQIEKSDIFDVYNDLLHSGLIIYPNRLSLSACKWLEDILEEETNWRFIYEEKENRKVAHLLQCKAANKHGFIAGIRNTFMDRYTNGFKLKLKEISEIKKWQFNRYKTFKSAIKGCFYLKVINNLEDMNELEVIKIAEKKYKKLEDLILEKLNQL